MLSRSFEWRRRYSDQAMGWTVRDSNLGRFRKLLQNVQPTQPSVDWISHFFPGLKRLGREIKHSPPYCVEVKIARAIPVLHLYISRRWQGRFYRLSLFSVCCSAATFVYSEIKVKIGITNSDFHGLQIVMVTCVCTSALCPSVISFGA